MKITLSVILLILINIINARAATTEEIDKYFQLDNQLYAKGKDNVAIAMVGLIAPADVKDSYAWGLKILQTPDMNYEKFKAIPNLLTHSVFDNKNFAYKKNGLQCWLRREVGEIGKKEGNDICFSRKEVEQFVVENKLFLERFQKMTQMKNYTRTPYGFLGAQNLIRGEQLYMVKLALDAEKDREGALKAWLANMRSVRSWNAGQSDWVMRSISMVVYGNVLGQLPVILNNDKVLANKYKNELAAVLAPFGSKDRNVDVIMKVEYQTLKLLYGVSYKDLGDHTVQKFYQLSQDYIYLAKLPAGEFEAENKKIREKYEGSSKESNFLELEAQLQKLKKSGAEQLPQDQKDKIGDQIVAGIAGVTSMVETMNIADARTRMYGVYAQVRALDIPRDKIAEFIKNAPPEMQDPFSRKPFEYDAKRNSITGCLTMEPKIRNAACNLVLN